MSAETILITGGAGFIGSHLAQRLLAEGRRVVVLDNFDPFYDPQLKRANVELSSAHRSYRLAEGDIRDAAAVDALFAEETFDAVIHLAARAGVRPSIREPLVYTSVNLDGTSVMLEACRKHGVGKLLFGSSSSVYGNNRKFPFAEDDPVDHPISPYAATKKAGEVLCHVYHHLFGMQVACLRFFTVYGPRQRPEMAIHKFTALLAAGREIEQYGDGTSARDYTYVSDIVEGVVRALERCDGYHIWNLGGSGWITLHDLVHAIAAELGVQPRIERLPAQPGDVERTCADVSKARRELDWAPRVEIRQGIAEFVRWFEQQHVRSGPDGGRK